MLINGIAAWTTSNGLTKPTMFCSFFISLLFFVHFPSSPTISNNEHVSDVRGKNKDQQGRQKCVETSRCSAFKPALSGP